MCALTAATIDDGVEATCSIESLVTECSEDTSDFLQWVNSMYVGYRSG